jgi:biotin carboxyl carrier protein
MTDSKDNNLESFSIGGMHYKTRLTRKFKNRRRYDEPDINLVKAFIPGTIVEIKVKRGQKVTEGEPLLLLEAMKMRNIINSPKDGRVKKIWVKQGEKVTKNQLLVELH